MIDLYGDDPFDGQLCLVIFVCKSLLEMHFPLNYRVLELGLWYVIVSKSMGFTFGTNYSLWACDT